MLRRYASLLLLASHCGRGRGRGRGEGGCWVYSLRGGRPGVA